MADKCPHDAAARECVWCLRQEVADCREYTRYLQASELRAKELEREVEYWKIEHAGQSDRVEDLRDLVDELEDRAWANFLLCKCGEPRSV